MRIIAKVLECPELEECATVQIIASVREPVGSVAAAQEVLDRSGCTAAIDSALRAARLRYVSHGQFTVESCHQVDSVLHATVISPVQRLRSVRAAVQDIAQKLPVLAASGSMYSLSVQRKGREAVMLAAVVQSDFPADYGKFSTDDSKFILERAELMSWLENECRDVRVIPGKPLQNIDAAPDIPVIKAYNRDAIADAVLSAQTRLAGKEVTSAYPSGDEDGLDEDEDDFCARCGELVIKEGNQFFHASADPEHGLDLDADHKVRPGGRPARVVSGTMRSFDDVSRDRVVDEEFLRKNFDASTLTTNQHRVDAELRRLAETMQ